MKKPNLFILGAPKCGTTAMATWLATHPDVFVSPVKEPHYFSEEHKLTPSLDIYEALFAEAGNHHKWVCEASVWYLFSETAVPNILQYAPDARFVVMVRNPVDMAVSMHEQQRFNGNELVSEFAEALLLNDARSRGNGVGVRQNFAPVQQLAYFESCALGMQLARLLECIPRQRLHLTVFDDLAADPETVYRDLLSFLELPDVLPDSFAKINAAKRRKSFYLDAAVLALAKLKNRLGIRRRLHFLSNIRKSNVIHHERAELPMQLRSEMISVFRDDVILLGTLIEKNLDAWLENHSP